MTGFLNISEVSAGAISQNLEGCWVPSEAVSCHLLDAPNVPDKKLQGMIPWMLEEHCLAPPEQLSFAVAQQRVAGRLPVITVAHSALSGWRESLFASGVHCPQLIPDFFMLPWREGSVSLSVSEGRAILRTGQFQGLAGPADWVVSLLGLKEFSQRELDVYGSVPEALFENVAQQRINHAGIVARFAPEKPFLAFQGVAATSKAASLGRPEKAALALLMLVLILAPAASLVQTARINTEANQVETVLKDAYRRITGEEYRGDIKRFRSKLLTATGSGALPPTEGLPGELRRANDLLAGCPDCQVMNIVTSTGGLVLDIRATPAAEQWLASDAFLSRDDQIRLSVTEQAIQLKIPFDE
ncbi:MAG: type II secretion system protein GspL [bacterium]